MLTITMKFSMSKYRANKLDARSREEARQAGLRYTEAMEFLTWHVGNGKVFDSDSYSSAQRVIEVQADGHELRWIQQVLGIGEDIDTNQVRVVRFFGDQAKFIAANLR